MTWLLVIMLVLVLLVVNDPVLFPVPIPFRRGLLLGLLGAAAAVAVAEEVLIGVEVGGMRLLCLAGFLGMPLDCLLVIFILVLVLV